MFSTAHAGYTGIPGIKVVGEQDLEVTNEAMSFQWKDHGFKLHIPEDLNTRLLQVDVQFSEEST